jgi:hypothetical protein
MTRLCVQLGTAEVEKHSSSFRLMGTFLWGLDPEVCELFVHLEEQVDWSTFLGHTGFHRA